MVAIAAWRKSGAWTPSQDLLAPILCKFAEQHANGLAVMRAQGQVLTCCPQSPWAVYSSHAGEGHVCSEAG